MAAAQTLPTNKRGRKSFAAAKFKQEVDAVNTTGAMARTLSHGPLLFLHPHPSPVP
jgi:hypothetical protein